MKEQKKAKIEYKNQSVAPENTIKRSLCYFCWSL